MNGEKNSLYIGVGLSPTAPMGSGLFPLAISSQSRVSTLQKFNREGEVVIGATDA